VVTEGASLSKDIVESNPSGREGEELPHFKEKEGSRKPLL